MKKIFSILILCFLISISFTNHIAKAKQNDRWIRIYSDIEEQFFFDTKTLEEIKDGTNTVLKAWIKIEYTKDYGTKISKEKGYNEPVSHSLELWNINMANKKIFLLYDLSYSENDNTLDNSGPILFSADITPSSREGKIANLVYEYYYGK